MQSFEMFIDDDRYTVPTLRLLLVKDARRARAMAEDVLSESAHHRGVEICRAGAWLFGVGSLVGGGLPAGAGALPQAFR